jgi:hypothetical protein
VVVDVRRPYDQDTRALHKARRVLALSAHAHPGTRNHFSARRACDRRRRSATNRFDFLRIAHLGIRRTVSNQAYTQHSLILTFSRWGGLLRFDLLAHASSAAQPDRKSQPTAGLVIGAGSQTSTEPVALSNDCGA